MWYSTTKQVNNTITKKTNNMPKSKHRKNHKKKLAARKDKLAQNKKRYEKMQREFISQLIEQEKQKGMFENMPEIPNVDGPSTDGPVVEGPSI
jgi:hypothetical protein